MSEAIAFPRSEFANGTAFACPSCGAFDGSDVMDSRPNDGSIRRRRACKACGHRFTTWEVLVNPAAIQRSAAELRATARKLEEFAAELDKEAYA